MVCCSCLFEIELEEDWLKRRMPVARIGRGLFAASWMVTGILVFWVVLYLAGRTLIRMPSNYHEGSAWQEQLVK